MALSDAQINRLFIRKEWNRAVGAGGPWGQTVIVDGKQTDLGAFYEWIAAADPEHGLEAAYIDMMALRGGDDTLRKVRAVVNMAGLTLPYIQSKVDALVAKLVPTVRRKPVGKPAGKESK